MAINETGLALIRGWEGCRLKAYKDPVGILTIGYGHTSMAGPPEVRLGMTISQEEAERMLATDLVRYEAAVDTVITQPMNENERAAMISLCYNIGGSGFARSSVARYFNEGNKAKAAASFLMWVKAGGKTLPGLINRRNAEMDLFLTPTRKAAEAHIPDLDPVKPEDFPTPSPVSVGRWGAIAALLAGIAAGFWQWFTT